MKKRAGYLPWDFPGVSDFQFIKCWHLENNLKERRPDINIKTRVAEVFVGL